MDYERAKTISPIIDFLHPDLPDREKERLTEVIRPYFRAHYEAYCRMDADGLLGGDSREIEGNGRLGVAKTSDV